MNKNTTKSFLSRIARLGGNSWTTSEPTLGTVRLLKPASETKCGERMFSVSKSQAVRNGSYTWSGLKSAIESV